MRVLVGFECSGVVASAFRKRGHAAYSCDIQPFRGTDPEGPAFHLQCDIWHALRYYQWDLGIFHPDCTYLTVSGAWAFKDGPYHMKVKPGTLTGAARRAAREEALVGFKRLLALPFDVVLENPAPSFLGTMVRPADQIIQPHQFGDDASKSTGLWRNCNLPDLRPTAHVEPRWVDGKPRWANQTDSGQNKLSPSDDRAHLRSITWPGIAEAMADQWGGVYA